MSARRKPPAKSELPRLSAEAEGILKALGVVAEGGSGEALAVASPIDGAQLIALKTHTNEEADAAFAVARARFASWRAIPAPARANVIRRFSALVAENKENLARLISIENGKTIEEGRGEVQEVIDICDHAIGLSRLIEGKNLPSERPGHRLSEQWHPMGVLGLITAFNFPAAVWAWGAVVALVCGNITVWKPSEKTPLTAFAFSGLLNQAAAENPKIEGPLSQVIFGGAELGQRLADSPDIAVINATGSTRMGRDVAARAARRFARCVLELGGNNAAIIAPDADLSLALSGVVFAAAGTAGQRCTSLRRLIVHEAVYDEFIGRLRRTYANLPIGSPLEAGTLVGPLITESAFDAMQAALGQARAEGGVVTGGERVDIAGCEGGFYVRPAIVEMPGQSAIVREETFAPILYVLRYRDFDEAVALQNDVRQGLSSSVFTSSLALAEAFQSASGSDCGIVNVNVGTSGAEIGGGFGGEKDTGGGRVAGSDTWKNYMRRVTSTVNFSGELPLAQGIRFDAGSGE